MTKAIRRENVEAVRAVTKALCAPLTIEDHVVQPAPFVSPPKWHLAHTTWFFETFVLSTAIAQYAPRDSTYSRLFNSYYNSHGEHWQQSSRGTLSRPCLSEVNEYRNAVDEALGDLTAAGLSDEIATFIELGLHHEQQHQELLVMDIKAILGANPCMPAYTSEAIEEHRPVETRWVRLSGGRTRIGTETRDGFSYDNERPRHEVVVPPFAIASSLVSNQQYVEFINDGGYRRAELWLSDGWDVISANGWREPRYWFERDGQWRHFSLRGDQALDPAEPVAHISYYEADAFARWADARLPTEHEWEYAAHSEPLTGRFLDAGDLAPRAQSGERMSGLHGTLWQWTASPYVAYPGYVQPSGALGEYNGKFMVNQMVLRGGCYATPKDHYRSTYRNFYKPEMRWQCAGIRLAKDDR